MKFRSANVVPPELDMTPMIDVVFQLIMFFMLINKFAQAETDERIVLPKDQLAAPPAVRRENSLMLNFGYVRDQKGVIIDRTPYVFFGDERAELDSVRPRLRQESQYYQTTGTDLSEITVEIRADADIPAGLIQELIQMCQEEGIAFQRFALKPTQRATEY